jgi:hypothetical protein
MTQVIDLLGYERIAALASIFPFAPARERFIFVRHGETEGNRNRVYQFPHTPLNAAGEGQAQLAARSLATIRIGKLVASPMARAWRTASLVAAAHKMHPEVDGALSERFYVSLWISRSASGSTGISIPTAASRWRRSCIAPRIA